MLALRFREHVAAVAAGTMPPLPVGVITRYSDPPSEGTGGLVISEEY
jgi:hypothetical protein